MTRRLRPSISLLRSMHDALVAVGLAGLAGLALVFRRGAGGSPMEDGVTEDLNIDRFGDPDPDAVARAQATDEDDRFVARVLWGEARGEGRDGMVAVMNVIMTRAASPAWPNTWRGVAEQPWQFSALNKGDPNRERLLSVDESDAAFRMALDIVHEARQGRLTDNTGSADHYHVTGINPNWASPDRVTAVVGNHQFYRLTNEAGFFV